MDNYIDYDYYKNTFKGDLIPQDKFDIYAIKASGKVRTRIMNRDITQFKILVQNATCIVAEIIYNQNLNKEKLQNIINGTDKLVTSEKVGDYSRNISNLSIEELQNISSNEFVDNLINQELESQLLFTGLLYCGVPSV